MSSPVKTILAPPVNNEEYPALAPVSRPAMTSATPRAAFMPCPGTGRRITAESSKPDPTKKAKSGRAAVTIAPMLVEIHLLHWAEGTQRKIIGCGFTKAGLLSVSSRFERELSSLSTLPGTPNTLVWEFPNDEVSEAGLKAYIVWLKSLHLPLSASFNGIKKFDLAPGWDIEQYVAIFEVMQYMEIKKPLGHDPVRDEIKKWLKAGDLVTAHLTGIWRCTKDDEGVRKLLVHEAFEFAYSKESTVALFEAEFARYEDLMEKWSVRKEQKAKDVKKRHDQRRQASNGRKDVSGGSAGDGRPSHIHIGHEYMHG